MCILVLNAIASRLSVMGPSKMRTPNNSQEKYLDSVNYLLVLILNEKVCESIINYLILLPHKQHPLHSMC